MMIKKSKTLAVAGLGLVGLGLTGSASADTWSEHVAEDTAKDQFLMKAWRIEVENVKKANAEAELAYNQKVAHVRAENSQKLADYHAEVERVKIANEKAKVAFNAEAEAISKENSKLKAEYQEALLQFRMGSIPNEPKLPTYKPAPELVLEKEPQEPELTDVGTIPPFEARPLPVMPDLPWINPEITFGGAVATEAPQTSTGEVGVAGTQVDIPGEPAKFLAVEQALEVEKTSSGNEVTVDQNSEKLWKVSWVDEDGKELKPTVTVSPKDVPKRGEIDGYAYLTAKQDAETGEVTYIFTKGGRGDTATAPEKEPETTKGSEQSTTQGSEQSTTQGSEQTTSAPQTTQSAPQTSTQNEEKPTSPDNTAVFIGRAQEIAKEYTYEQKNADQSDILRVTTESKAQAEGLKHAESEPETAQKRHIDAVQREHQSAGVVEEPTDHAATGGTGNAQLPQTGDSGNALALAGSMIIMASGALLVRRRKTEN